MIQVSLLPPFSPLLHCSKIIPHVLSQLQCLQKTYFTTTAIILHFYQQFDHTPSSCFAHDLFEMVSFYRYGTSIIVCWVDRLVQTPYDSLSGIGKIKRAKVTRRGEGGERETC